MSFLKKLGSLIVNLAGIAAGVGPLIGPFLGSGKAGQVTGVAVNDLTAIGSIIVQIEAAFAAVPGSTGAQKLQASIPLIAGILKTSQMVVGKKIQNEALFTKAAQEYAQATVDLLNSIHPDAATPA